MEGSLFLSLTYDGRSKLVVANRNTTFSDVVREASEEWGPLITEKTVLTTTVGSLSNCSFKNDQDMALLFMFCEQFGEKLATVLISNPEEERVPLPSPIRNTMNEIPPMVLSKKSMFNVDESGCSSYSPQNTNPTPLIIRTKKRVVSLPSTNVDEFSGSGSLPNYGVSPLLEKKASLSDGWRRLIIGNGQVFRGGADEFRDKVIRFTSKEGFFYYYNRNDSRYIHVVCTERGTHDCGWFIKAGRQIFNNYFVINQSHMTHNCVGKLVTQKKSRLGAAIFGRLFTDSIRQDPTARGTDVLNSIKANFGFDVSYSRAHRTTQFTKGQIFGSYSDSYQKLPAYCDAVKRTNPGSVAEVHSEPDSNHFQKVFVSFHASLEAFKTCRPILFIDGTFPGGRAKGTILAATAKDGNNGLVPVAFAVVSSENLENWKWFLEMLRDHNNLKALFNGKGCGPQRDKMWELFKDVAYAPNLDIFDEKMRLFKEAGGDRAADWVDTLPPEKWSVAHSSHILRYGEMTSNAIESFNHWILNARPLPVTYMIDTIRMGLMRWFLERRAEGAKWTGALCQHKEEHWNALTDLGSTWNVLESTSGDYEVLCETTSVKVSLTARKCSCYQWQIRGFPCAHAVAVIRKVCNDVSDVVNPHFFVSNYRKCYSYDLNPIPQSALLECPRSILNQPPLLPPANDSTLGDQL